MVSQMLINYEELQNRLYRLSLHTTAHTQMVNITRQVQEIVKSSGVTNGLCVIYVPHTTAAITINENTDPDVQTDFMKEINKIVPWEDDYQHAE